MNDEALRDALASELGAGAVTNREPVSVDGESIDTRIRPENGEALARALAVLAKHGAPAVIRGGGNRLGLGNPPRGARVLLSTAALDDIDEFEPAEGVCHARAGTTLARVRETVRAEAWELPLDACGDGATVGGVLAAAAVGPRVQGFGRPRDTVLGLEVALPGGERTRCGGRVVKNVTGYDMAKLYTGSLGTLGVIEGAWLRLRPVPEQTWSGAAAIADAAAACGAGVACSRLGTARVAAIRAGSDAAVRLVLELAGDAPAVARDVERAAEIASGFSSAPDSVAALRAEQGSLAEPGGLRFRFGVLPSRIIESVSSLRAAGATLLVYPGAGLAWAAFALDPADPVGSGSAAFAAVSAAATASRSGFVLESAPPDQKRGRDVFAENVQTLALIRALKRRFDPEGLVNPGRGPGFA